MLSFAQMAHIQIWFFLGSGPNQLAELATKTRLPGFYIFTPVGHFLASIFYYIPMVE